MWVDRLFIFNSNKPEGRKNYMYQLAHTYPPGQHGHLAGLDRRHQQPAHDERGLHVRRRAWSMAKRIGSEKLAGGELDNKQFNDFVTSGPLLDFFSKPDATVRTPHVLKDGADSVGLLGALNRVYLNIGLFSEEWLLHFNPVVGGKDITPIKIADAQKNSSYWQATEAGTPNTALFFLKAAQPDRLKDAPGGASTSTRGRGDARARQGRLRRHLRALPFEQGAAAAGAVSGDVRRAPATSTASSATGSWTQTDEFKEQMRKVVQAPDFLDDNYLSTDARIPVTLLRTNACSPLATNALGGNIWDNFSSQSYKQLPSVGTVTLYDPFTGEPMPYQMPAGGRGYTRVPSLISLWSTAPFLLNNTVGPFDTEPVGGRAHEGLRRLDRADALAREARARLGARRQGARHDRPHDRAQQRHHPDRLRPGGAAAAAGHAAPLAAVARRRRRATSSSARSRKGMPVALLANLKLRAESDDLGDKAAHVGKIGEFLVKLKVDLADRARRRERRRAAPALRQPEASR